MEPILCIQILDINGDHVWVPRYDYLQNPELGSIVINDRVTRFEPIVKESCDYWKIDPSPVRDKHGEYYRAYGGRQHGKSANSAEVYLQMKREQDEQRRKRENWLKGK